MHTASELMHEMMQLKLDNYCQEVNVDLMQYLYKQSAEIWFPPSFPKKFNHKEKLEEKLKLMQKRRKAQEVWNKNWEQKSPAEKRLEYEIKNHKKLYPEEYV